MLKVDVTAGPDGCSRGPVRSRCPLAGLAAPPRGAGPGRRLGAPPVALLARPRRRADQRRARRRHRRRGQAARRRAALPGLARIPRRRRLPRPARARDPGRARGLAERGLRDRHAGRPARRLGLRRAVRARVRREPVGAAHAARHADPRARSSLAMGIWAAVSLAGDPAARRPAPAGARPRLAPRVRDPGNRALRLRGRRLRPSVPAPARARSSSPSPPPTRCSPRRWSRSPSPGTGTRAGGSGTCSCSPRSRSSPGSRGASGATSASPTSTSTRRRAHCVPSACSSPISRASPSTRRARTRRRVGDARGVLGRRRPGDRRARRRGGKADRRRGHGRLQRARRPARPCRERAVRAGLAFQAAAREVALEHPDWPRFRVGVNTGEAHVGVVGTAGHREYAALGDVVNTASRLEGQAGVGQVVIGARTYAALPDGTAVDPLGGLRVKGKDAPVEAYVVVSLPPGALEPLVAGRQQRDQRRARSRRRSPRRARSPARSGATVPGERPDGGREEDDGQDGGEPGLDPAERRGRRSVHNASERGETAGAADEEPDEAEVEDEPVGAGPLGDRRRPRARARRARRCGSGRAWDDPISSASRPVPPLRYPRP